MASSGELRIEIEQDAGPSGSLTVVRATGEVDLTNAEDLERALAAADGALVLDLTGVGFMDSSGLRVLLVKAAEPEPELALVLHRGSPVLRLIELSAVQDRIPWFEDETDAVTAVESADGANG